MDLTALESLKTKALFGNLSFNLPGGFVFQPSYLQAGLIIFLIFLLVLTLGQLRHRMNEWAINGLVPGLAFGFCLAILLEGIMLVTGGSLITKVLGWKDAPKPITNALDQGKGELLNVLGANDSQSSVSATKELGPEGVIKEFNKLSPSEADSVTKLICE